MTNLELVLNMLAEATTTELSKKGDPQTFVESKHIAVKGGTVAGNTRRDIEQQLGESIVTSKNAQDNLFKSRSNVRIEEKKKKKIN